MSGTEIFFSWIEFRIYVFQAVVYGTLQPTRRLDLENPEIECLTLELNGPSPLNPCFLFFCYRPPNFPPATFFQNLSTNLTTVSNFPIFVLGDFNARQKPWDSGPSNPAGTHFRNLLLDFGLTQCVMTPTRFSPDESSSSTLDLFATNRPDVVDSITTSDPISDHCGVFARLSLRRPPNSPLRSLCLPDYERTDWTALRTTIYNLPLFEAIQGTTDVDVAWQVWRGLVWNAVLQHVPFRTITLRPKNKFWMNSYLHKLSRRKLRLFRAATRQQTQVAWDAYKSFRNFCNAEFTRAKKQYTKRQQNTLQSETDGSRTWWTKAKRLSRISTPQTSLPTLKCPETDTIADTPPEKAELLANFFATQCTSPTPPMTFPVGAPYPLPEEHPMFDFPLITEHTVMRCLRRLPPSKSSGCSVLSHRVLREIAPAVCASLTYLYNLSIKTGTFPNDWKTAVVTPIFKNRGKTENPSNYRPISLLPAVGKILDHIQSQALCRYLVDRNILTEHQFGFLPERSTTQQLIYITDRWLTALNDSKRVLAAFMDFNKAFDRVWHPGLLLKLGNCGLQPNALRWLSDYLSDRKLVVRVDSTLSSPQLITAGVPQGSHLGPVLFTAFINDLPSAVRVPTELYADDALLHQVFSRSHPSDDVAVLQASLSAASSWATCWNGRFSPEKTVLMEIKPSNSASTPLSPVLLEGQPVNILVHHKHLGITFQSDLSWSAHLEKLISKGTQRAGLLKLMSRTLPSDVIAKLYLHYVRPVLEYASPLWHSATPATTALAMERIQASIARTVLRADWMTPKDQLLEQLAWPSLRWRRTVASLAMFHKLLHMQHTPLSTCIPPHLSELSSRSRRKPLDVRLPPTRTSRYAKSFFFHCSLLWNSLPSSLQRIKSTTLFQHNLEVYWAQYKYNTSSDIPLPPT